jgi:hypothetical protein
MQIPIQPHKNQTRTQEHLNYPKQLTERTVIKRKRNVNADIDVIYIYQLICIINKKLILIDEGGAFMNLSKESKEVKVNNWCIS